jgi:hypothetical protein
VATVCHSGEDVSGVDGLLDSRDDAEFVQAVTIVGRSGGALPTRSLTRGLSADETTVRQTVYCLGMAGDPRLAGIAEDPALPPTTRRAARWWIEQGSRVLV